MFGNTVFARAVGAVVAALLSLGLMASPALSETFVIASLSDNSEREMRRYRGFANYVEDNLEGSSFTLVEVIIIPRSDLMVEAFLRDRAHIYIDSPLVALRIANASGAQPMLRRWRRGVSEFWSEFLVRADSGIEGFADFEGKVLGFEEPESTSGHYLPRSEVLAAGADVVTMFHLDDPREPDAVNSLFYSDDEVGTQWLLDGEIDIMTIGMADAQEIIEESDGEIISIARTMAVPRHMVVRHPGLADSDVTWLTDLLLDMDDHDEGRRVLENWSNTVRFDQFPEGLDATVETLNERLSLLDQGGMF
ncbi:MAG: PhnD/SsuA/transferrin family substrate-binding protein [Devosiaceae bacterium]|nr:PhnD/SsuA/transferrin family substrate-binding protein [Devosiaceae bacterium MH13]